MTQKVVRLHVGVHKTATTYLQQYLLRNRGVLAREGLAYWPMEDVRGTFHSAWEQLVADGQSLRGRLGTKVRGDRTIPQMRGWFQLDRDILLSEENFLGECCDFFDGAVYPNAGARLRLLSRALPPDRPQEVWLCLRSYPDFLASVYGEAARFWKVPAPDVFAERHARPEGVWPDLVDRIRAALPDARLHIWNYDDFRRVEPKIIEGMTGVPVSRLHSLGESDVRPSASDKAVRACASLPENIQGTERMFRMMELEERYPMRDRADRFSPWTAEQRTRMAAAWHQDIERIAARHDVAFIQ